MLQTLRGDRSDNAQPHGGADGSAELEKQVEPQRQRALDFQQASDDAEGRREMSVQLARLIAQFAQRPGGE